MSRESIIDYTFTSEEARRIRLALSRMIIEDVKVAKYLEDNKCANMAASFRDEIKATERLLQLMEQR